MGNGSLARKPEMGVIDTDGAKRCLAEFARHDPAHCLAPGLFRSIRNSAPENLDITYVHGETTVRFLARSFLGAEHQRLLTALVALAGVGGETLSPTPTTEIGKTLRELISAARGAQSVDCIMARASVRRILRECGLSGGRNNIDHMRKLLVDLGSVSIYFRTGRGRRRVEGMSHLLSWALDHETDEIAVALNARLTRTILGGQHTRINMDDLRALRGDVAQLIYHRLSGWLNPGETARVGIDTLVGHVWLEPSATAGAARKRRRRIRSALLEINALPGWGVQVAPDVCTITRPMPAAATGLRSVGDATA